MYQLLALSPYIPVLINQETEENIINYSIAKFYDNCNISNTLYSAIVLFDFFKFIY